MVLSTERVDMPPHIARKFEYAECKGMPQSVFFPDKGGSEHYLAGKLVCKRCPIIETCRAWSLNKPEMHGLWGGMTPDERRTILRLRGA